MRMFAVPLIAVLAACATPEDRVETALLEAGLSPSVSACMAQRMTDRLSIAQLRTLSQAVRGTEAARQLSLDDIQRRVAAIDDPEIVSVTASAGLSCFLRG